MLNDFYVYVYLDVLKPGDYLFGGECFTFEPIYIGLGKRDRLKMHLIKAKNRTNKIHSPNPHLIHRIRRMLDDQKTPVIVKLHEDLTKSEAIALERSWIKSIGRRDLDLGPLLNLTDGGEGTGEWNDERRAAFRIKMSGENNSFYGKRHPDEIRQRRTYTSLSPEHKRKQSISAKQAIREGRLKLPNNHGVKNPFYGIKPVKAIAGKVVKTINNVASLGLDLTEDNYMTHRVSKSCPKWSRIEEYLNQEQIRTIYSTALKERQIILPTL